MPWSQTYSPVAGSVILSALIASLPIVILLSLLAFFHLRAHLAAALGLFASLLIAVLIYGMPVTAASAAAVNGAAFGLFPIGWIVISAIFVYNITVETGKFEVIKSSIYHLAGDDRIQALIIAFCFGAFVEGAAGFGTPVAISAAMLIGLGFPPLRASCVALIGNTAPVAFGALGTPIIALAKVTGIPIEQLSSMVGRQLPFFSLLIPFWLIWSMAGFRRMLEVWPACFVSGASFGLVQFLVSNYHGPWVVDIAAAAASVFSLLVLLRFWQPARVERNAGASESPLRPTGQEALLGWMPWIILSLIVFVWGLPQVKAWMNGFASIDFHVPYLDRLVNRVPPVVPQPRLEDAIFTLNWLSATGTGLLLSGLISGLLLKLHPLRILTIFLQTLVRVRFSLMTIAAMLALGFTTRYAGLDATMGLAFATTGSLFPFFSAVLGWLGVALTGSDTSSNVLFGNLQQITAQQVGISPVLAAASNSAGGVMGKMIDAQSIVVAGVATGQVGKEGEILRYVFFHSLALVCLVGILVWVQAYLLTGMIPR